MSFDAPDTPYGVLPSIIGLTVMTSMQSKLRSRYHIYDTYITWKWLTALEMYKKKQDPELN